MSHQIYNLPGNQGIRQSIVQVTRKPQLALYLQSNLENLGWLVGRNTNKMFASLLHHLSIHNLEMIIAFWKILCLWPAPFSMILWAEDSARSHAVSHNLSLNCINSARVSLLSLATTETTGSPAYRCCWGGLSSEETDVINKWYTAGSVACGAYNGCNIQRPYVVISLVSWLPPAQAVGNV